VEERRYSAAPERAGQGLFLRRFFTQP